MPYLPKEDREYLEDHRALKGGHLNYQVSVLMNNFLAMKGLSYATLNEAVGALECAKLELYRRVAAPYEDTKAMSNGDVYTFQSEKA